ncbi:MAG: CehA/McbA family metallohydrolase, partial [Acidobacteriota bacterium]|nr:CehA/McbA family metallohydrolase [Acidobacteriota bacterium]
SSADRNRIDAALNSADEAAAVSDLQNILDPYVLLILAINAESRVQVTQGTAPAELLEAGTRLFLVKVRNQAGVTAALQVHSPNSEPVYVSAWKDESPEPKERVTVEDIRNRWADISLYNEQPFTNRLSGLALQYAILQVYSRDAGQRLARIGFDVGSGTQDISARKDVDILFHSRPARSIRLQVVDDDRSRTMASFIFRDRLGRIYPNPSKRLAPDFFFQPQVYRADGETIRLPDGSYEVTCTGGPEYVTETRRLEIAGEMSRPASFQLKRWIHPAQSGWYPGDHHLHAAGCSHYVTPTEGVDPAVMMRQVQGEHLSVGCVLNWAPCYYHQKQFFTAQDNPLSKPDTILHYDLEVSGFPSSHCGHLVLLGLKDQNYPGTKRVEQWPTWNLPILQWAKAQGAVVGYPHSGWGLAVKSEELPNFEMPAFDGIGANEYIVDVTHPNTVDFMSAGDTPYVWELNIWYHTLNVGFRARLSGETDFPCITDNRVGQARLYARVDGPLNYRGWLNALREGRSYVSDGKSHLMEFAVNGVELGTGGSELQIAEPGTVEVTVKTAAYLDTVPNSALSKLPYDKEPYWHIERARIGATRGVPVELVWNGRCIASRNLLGDGSLQTLSFTVPIEESGWMALRILPSSHTNPIFVTVGGKRMRPSARSAQWCLTAVDQCWSQKAAQISGTEIAAAKKAYEHARETYKMLVRQGI